MRVLITGGAGFIGSHLADELMACGHQVRALDSLTPQVHGDDQRRPAYLDPEVDLVVGDMRDTEALARALDRVDAVVHLAAVVGVGQSMYEAARYASVNVVGTAGLLEALIRRPVGRLVVASSMSIYGEGLYADEDGEPRTTEERPIAALQRGEWDPVDPAGRRLTPLPTPETKPPSLASVYALTKFDQERMTLIMARAYGIPAVAMRFFNVYGTRQALSNPYTGVMAIFGSRLLNGNRPMVFEDGRQRRDFVHVRDVARACRFALESPVIESEALNIGSGRSVTIGEVGEKMARACGRPDLTPEITGKHRRGDIRHCFADISRAREVLGFEPQIALDEGLVELAEWLDRQIAEDRVDDACAELAARGLTV